VVAGVLEDVPVGHLEGACEPVLEGQKDALVGEPLIEVAGDVEVPVVVQEQPRT
jgi:hypothetical protein